MTPAEKKAYNAAYYLKRREELCQNQKEYYRAHAKERCAYWSSYRRIHKEKVREDMRAYMQGRRKKDPSFRMRSLLSRRIGLALAGKNKSARMQELLGCTIEFLRQHLEKQFLPKMSWENYGPVWQIDHILPCAAFHLQHSEEQEVCFHWTNLQPLFITDNLNKSDKII